MKSLGPLGSRRDNRSHSPPSTYILQSQVILLVHHHPPPICHCSFFLPIQISVLLICHCSFSLCSTDLNCAVNLMTVLHQEMNTRKLRKELGGDGRQQWHKCNWDLCSSSGHGEWDWSQVMSYLLSVHHRIPTIPTWVEVPGRRTWDSSVRVSIVCNSTILLQILHFVHYN